jgi:predicted negative regulator of RcsB-dependent stress response
LRARVKLNRGRLLAAPEFPVNRQTRKQLKTDKFAQEVNQTVSFLSEHRTESIRYGLIALAVIVLGSGYYFYNRHQATVRETALAEALRIDDAVIGPADTPTNKAFPTQEAKDKARAKAFSDLAMKYHGTTEGAIGAVYMAADQADKGNYSQAESIYKDVADSAPKVYATQAELALAQVYAADGKTADAEKILRKYIDHPTELVSSDAAKLYLANILAATDSKENQKEALSLAQPLTTSNHVYLSKQALNVVSRVGLSSPGTK